MVQSYHLHVEATRVLAVLLSGVLYCPGKPAHQLAVWREIMAGEKTAMVMRRVEDRMDVIMLCAGEASVLVTPLTCVLLQRYCDQTPAPDLDTGGSLVLGLASSVWSILTLGQCC